MKITLKTSEKMIYDRADWHYGGDYPEDLPTENGGTHIGMFLAWAINNNLEGEVHQQVSQESLKAIRNKEITGREFLKIESDERFWEDDLNEEGNAFANFYYESNKYFSDYSATLAGGLPSLYHVEDNWENYHTMETVISHRYRKWKIHQGKKWWQFWK